MKVSVLAGLCCASSSHLQALEVEPDGTLSTTATSTRRQRLQMLETQSKALLATKLSPDAKDIITNTLLPTVSDIQNLVLREFNSTQNRLRTAVEKVESAATTAQSLREDAVKHDIELNDCRSGQLTAMTELEKCVADRNAKISADNRTCEDKRDAAEAICGERDRAANITFDEFCLPISCNLADGLQCDIKNHESMMAGRSAHVAEQLRIYTEKGKECEAATKEADDFCDETRNYANNDECEPKREEVRSKAAVCEHMETSTSVAICSFGVKLQTKCGDLTEVKDLVASIRSSNRIDALSEPDRQAEWAAIQRLSCLLEALHSDGDLSTAATQTCADGRPYPLMFDFFDARIANLACDETAITFSGHSWIMGETVAQCVQSDAALEFTAAADKAPFALCEDTVELIGEGVPVEQNTKVGEVQASQSYHVSFVITPNGLTERFGNILHFSQTGKYSGLEGDRMPAFFFWPSTTKLHIVASAVGKPNECNPQEPLPIKKATKVDLVVAKDHMGVFIDGRIVPECSDGDFRNPTAPSGTMVVWASTPPYGAADAVLSHVTYRQL